MNRKDSYWVWPISGTSIGFRVTATIFDYPVLTGNLHGRSKISTGFKTIELRADCNYFLNIYNINVCRP